MDNLKPKPYGEFADYLRRLRESRGYTQAELATFLHMTPSAYGYYERGERRPSVGMVLSLMRFYRISFHPLLYFSAIPDCDADILSEFSYLKSEKQNSKLYDPPKCKHSKNTVSHVRQYLLDEDEWALVQFYRRLQAKHNE